MLRSSLFLVYLSTRSDSNYCWTQSLYPANFRDAVSSFSLNLGYYVVTNAHDCVHSYVVELIKNYTTIILVVTLSITLGNKILISPKLKCLILKKLECWFWKCHCIFFVLVQFKEYSRIFFKFIFRILVPLMKINWIFRTNVL